MLELELAMELLFFTLDSPIIFPAFYVEDIPFESSEVGIPHKLYSLGQELFSLTGYDVNCLF